MYCGKIYVRKFKEEESQWVKGQHEPLIPDSTYYQVQDTLDGKTRIYAPNKHTQDYPMRGFLICPDCGRLLTGSSSQGRSKKYYYYYCKLPCKARFHTDDTHELFSKELIKFIPRSPLNAGLDGNKKGQKTEISTLSCVVTPSGLYAPPAGRHD